MKAPTPASAASAQQNCRAPWLECPPTFFPSPPLCRQNVFRPREARPHAYHYAEDSARAVVAEQLESGRGQPTVEAM